MKKWLVILGSLLSGAASAELPMCDPTQPYSTDTTYMRFVAKDYYQRVDSGWYIIVACRDPVLKLWKLYGGVCRHGVCNQSDWAKAMIDYGMAVGDAAKKASFVASWNKIIVEDCSALPGDPLNAPICEVFRAKRDEIGVALNTVPLPPIIIKMWKVKDNPLSTSTPKSRPAFTLTCPTTGPCVRGTKEVMRFFVGEKCMPDRPKLAGTGGDFWMEVDAQKPGIVVLCSESP